MAQDIGVTGTDQFGNDAYKLLYQEIMYDIGKLASVERSTIVLKPEVPLFIISVKMKARPSARKIGDIAATRAEKGVVYVSISDEMYAPGTLARLWEEYGRDNVQQTDRLDITVRGADTSAEVDSLEVESSEQPVREILGALWRVLPEGIRVRREFENQGVITVVATEEIMRSEFLEEGKKVEDAMVKGVDYRV
ncbi:putative methanogenesis marker protein 17 [Thermoplasmatales archaeon BRNA1]|nr:putative methanogenesis marker protein 17 [Thermoplasmatales archaeon BRNA1]